jgi:hypothetical protein
LVRAKPDTYKRVIFHVVRSPSAAFPKPHDIDRKALGVSGREIADGEEGRLEDSLLGANPKYSPFSHVGR